MDHQSSGDTGIGAETLTNSETVKFRSQQFLLVTDEDLVAYNTREFVIVQANGTHLMLVNLYDRVLTYGEGVTHDVVLQPVRRVDLQTIDMPLFAKPLTPRAVNG